MRMSDGRAFTKREKQIVDLMSKGRSTKDIAGDLNLSLKTVRAHKFNAMRKAGVHNAVNLIQFAVREGIVTLGGGLL